MVIFYLIYYETFKKHCRLIWQEYKETLSVPWKTCFLKWKRRVYTFSQGGKMAPHFGTYVAQDIEILKEFMLFCPISDA